MNVKPLKYAIITPARNEGDYIKGLLDSVVRQTYLPQKWVIVSDGSTDETEQIVERYLSEYDWIELVRLPPRKERHFAGKVNAFNEGFARLSDTEYHLLGNLDADVSFDADYFEYLVGRFAENPKLGVAGTNRWEGSGLLYDYRFSSIEDVAGACQLFRKECYEEIGGYTPVKDGGIDLVAMLKARMKGWETKNFTEKYLIHHRLSGTATVSGLKVHYVEGRKDYLFGGHPLWELMRVSYRMTTSPLGAVLLAAGYVLAFIKRAPKTVPLDVVRFRRKEQMARLRRFLLRPFGFRKLLRTT
jgi:poly-beta-1,6-N-acetyl-D-glucosamine synthase